MLAENLRDFFNTSPHVDAFIKKGVISLAVKCRFDIYVYYEELYRLTYKRNRKKKTEAIRLTADKFKVSTQTVYRAIQVMES